ncbi:MAG: YbjN domain-containing protein [Henriciella sp.]|uniref:YbjN domain-containing protein n=1 Tax=Henriciella sp. TaxID=1968823 RepID=UPI0032EAED8A
MKLSSCILAFSLAVLPASAQFTNSMPGTLVDQEDGAPDRKLVDARDPEAIARILREQGYEAAIEKQENGAVEIQSKSGHANFWLYFHACTPHFTECEIITFSSGFDFETAQLPDIIGNWNATRFSKAYLDADGDPFVEFSVNMKDGVTRENFVDTLDWFTMEMSAFIERIGWNAGLAEQAQPI